MATVSFQASEYLPDTLPQKFVAEEAEQLWKHS